MQQTTFLISAPSRPSSALSQQRPCSSASTNTETLWLMRTSRYLMHCISDPDGSLQRQLILVHISRFQYRERRQQFIGIDVEASHVVRRPAVTQLVHDCLCVFIPCSRSPGHRVPWWVLIWIKRSPLIFLVFSVAAFSVGLCVFAYSTQQVCLVRSSLYTAHTLLRRALSHRHLPPSLLASARSGYLRSPLGLYLSDGHSRSILAGNG